MKNMIMVTNFRARFVLSWVVGPGLFVDVLTHLFCWVGWVVFWLVIGRSLLEKKSSHYWSNCAHLLISPSLLVDCSEKQEDMYEKRIRLQGKRKAGKTVVNVEELEDKNGQQKKHKQVRIFTQHVLPPWSCNSCHVSSMHGQDVEFGNIFFQEILLLVENLCKFEGKLSFRWIFRSFSYKNIWKFV